MARYLSIDLGDQRTGIATGDDVTGLVTPGQVIEIPCGDRLLDALVERIDDYGPDTIVIGLPLNMDDTEGERAKIVRGFAGRLADRVTIPIEFQDERLTSHAAEAHLNQSGRTHKQKKKVRDALAAAEILEEWMAG